MRFFGETEITDIPAHAHNRFGIRNELAFKLFVSWVLGGRHDMRLHVAIE
jgi:hypothetical protein